MPRVVTEQRQRFQCDMMQYDVTRCDLMLYLLHTSLHLIEYFERL